GKNVRSGRTALAGRAASSAGWRTLHRGRPYRTGPHRRELGRRHPGREKQQEQDDAQRTPYHPHTLPRGGRNEALHERRVAAGGSRSRRCRCARECGRLGAFRPASPRGVGRLRPARVGVEEKKPSRKGAKKDKRRPSQRLARATSSRRMLTGLVSSVSPRRADQERYTRKPPAVPATFPPFGLRDNMPPRSEKVGHSPQRA